MSDQFNGNRKKILNYFADCKTKEDRYQKIIDLGKSGKPFKDINKVPENLVTGCQSTTYLISYSKNQVVYFEADSDALISKGLVQLLIQVYSGLDAETIIKTPPDYLEELEIASSLTPSRANGLYNMHLKMKQEALKYLL